jgi:hypothetical protein
MQLKNYSEKNSNNMQNCNKKLKMSQVLVEDWGRNGSRTQTHGRS